MTETLTPVVITTDKRGVFFGYLSGNPDEAGDKLTISAARMCVYWSAEVRGVLGLAATGPVTGCKITASVPSITLNGVTSVMRATDGAAEAWEKGFWS